MLRFRVVIGLTIAVALAACDPGPGADPTTIPTTEATPTTSEATTIATPAPTTQAPTTIAASTAPSTAAETPDDSVIELAQFGLRFVVPEPYVEAPSEDTDFAAESMNPLGYFSILECGDCTLDFEPREGEVHIPRTIDGVPTLIIENPALDLPDSATAYELIVVDDQRNFSVIMSMDGNVAPSWESFMDSISFVDADPDAASEPVAADDDPAAAADGPLTIESVGVTFEWPEGFVGDPATDDSGGYNATREEPLAVAIVFPCPSCVREQLDDADSVEDIEVDGYPAVIGETTTPDGSRAYILIVLAEGHQVIATVAGTDVDDAWQDLLDSFQISDE